MEYENFVFYGSWTETLKAMRDKFGAEFAKDVAWEIIMLGTENKVETDDQAIAGIVNGMCQALIGRAKKRREASIKNGNSGGRPTEYKDSDFKTLRANGLTNQQIAEKLGCSLKTVERRFDKINEADIDI